MLSIGEMIDCCTKLSEQFNDTFSVPISINGRLTTTLGRCRSTRNPDGSCFPSAIEISKTYLETAPKEDVIQTIKHEWCHYYLTKVTKQHHGHDEAFYALCRKVGIADDRFHHFSDANAKELLEKRYKYTVYCPTCGRAIQGYTRMCKTLKYLDGCTCLTCGKGGLYYKQNW